MTSRVSDATSPRKQRPAAARGVETFRVLAQDHVVDLAGAEAAQRAHDAGKKLDRAHVGVEVEPEPQLQAEVEPGFRPVGIRHARKTCCAVQDGMRVAAALEGRFGKGIAGFPKMPRAGRVLAKYQLIGEAGHGPQHLERRRAHLRSDSVSFDDCDGVLHESPRSLVRCGKAVSAVP